MVEASVSEMYVGKNLRAGSPAWAFLSCRLLNGPEDWEQAAHTTASASNPLVEAAAAAASPAPSISSKMNTAEPAVPPRPADGLTKALKNTFRHYVHGVMHTKCVSIWRRQ